MNNYPGYNLYILGLQSEFSDRNKNIKKAVQLYETSANLGCLHAKCSLAYCYEHGNGVKQNIQKACDLYSECAELGNACAQCNLAMIYENGIHGEKNIKESIRLFKLSAIQGNADAQNILGYYYLKGLHIEKNLDEAVRLLTLSAECGNEYAINNLSDIDPDLLKYIKLNMENNTILITGNVLRKIIGNDLSCVVFSFLFNQKYR